MPTPRDSVKKLVVVPHPTSDNATVIEDYIAYRTTVGRRPWANETVRSRRSQLRMLAEGLHPVKLVDATEEEIFTWHQGRARTDKPETLAAYTSAAHGLYHWMCAQARPRLRTDDPTIAVERPWIPEAQPRPMLDRHYDLALACSLSNPELYLWLGLMGCSGLRCCEIAWMQIADVEELPNGTGLLHIIGKGRKRRTVPAGAMLLLTMRPFLTGRGSVFTRVSDGGAYTPQGVSQKVNNFLRELNIRDTAHSLRHRFGTDYHGLDPDLYRQAKIMGHGSVNTTQRYTEISPREAAKYVEQLTSVRLHEHRRIA